MLSLHSSFNALGLMPAGRFDWCRMISVKSNISEVLGFTARLNRQYEFAVASALTAVVKDVQAAMPAALEADLDKPTRFTKSGFGIAPARKDRLTAAVFAKTAQAQYLRYQIEGGQRQPKRKALRLPGNVQLDAFGNMPPALVRQLIARAKANKRVTKAQGKRFGLSRGLDLFYGDPQDDRPPGIYQRVKTSETESRLIPVVLFPAQPATYRKRFDFKGRARKIVLASLEPRLRAAWARAQATAR
jgi:hypothetical protein